MSNNEFKTVSYKTKKNTEKSQNTQRDTQLKNLERRIHNPKVDLVERNSFYLVRIELPGVTPESIKIQIKDRQIVLVSGSKLQEQINETDRIIYRECKYNNFIRRIKLPEPIKFFNTAEKLHLTNGVLHLTFERELSPLAPSNEDTSSTHTPGTLNLDEKVDWSEL
jgi:HSP20 family molecular chaperone IbpA